MKKNASSDINVYIIPHSRVDLEWYRNREEGCRRAVMVINAALKCMEKSSSFTFAQDNIALFPHLLENLPNEKTAPHQNLWVEHRNFTTEARRHGDK